MARTQRHARPRHVLAISDPLLIYINELREENPNAESASPNRSERERAVSL